MSESVEVGSLTRGFAPLESRVVATRAGRREIIRVIDENSGASRELSRTPMAGENPYLGAYLAITRPWRAARSFKGRWQAWLEVEMAARQRLVRDFAWAVPCEAALAAIAALGPVNEVAAGTGYWAKLLAERGVDVLASDWTPVRLPHDPFGRTASHFPVARAGAAASARAHPERALLLAWPPYAKPMAAEALAAYAGTSLALVGEHDEATADEDFFVRLERDWVLEQWVPIPQWARTRDDLTIWRRRN